MGAAPVKVFVVPRILCELGVADGRKGVSYLTLLPLDVLG